VTESGAASVRGCHRLTIEKLWSNPVYDEKRTFFFHQSSVMQSESFDPIPSHHRCANPFLHHHDGKD
jgi:hypothetical protein